jgi:hypothetical protein
MFAWKASAADGPVAFGAPDTYDALDPFGAVDSHDALDALICVGHGVEALAVSLFTPEGRPLATAASVSVGAEEAAATFGGRPLVSVPVSAVPVPVVPVRTVRDAADVGTEAAASIAAGVGAGMVKESSVVGPDGPAFRFFLLCGPSIAGSFVGPAGFASFGELPMVASAVSGSAPLLLGETSCGSLEYAASTDASAVDCGPDSGCSFIDAATPAADGFANAIVDGDKGLEAGATGVGSIGAPVCELSSCELSYCELSYCERRALPPSMARMIASATVSGEPVLYLKMAA